MKRAADTGTHSPGAADARIRGHVSSGKTSELGCFSVAAEDAGTRVDVFASTATGITRSRIRHLIETGLLTINKRTVKPNYRVKPGDIMGLSVPEPEEKLIPQDLGVRVLFRDDFLIVLDKPAGMVVYPAAGHSSGTLMNNIAHLSRKLASVGAPLRSGVVHRLDKDTTGVMVVALDDIAYYGLVEQFRERSVDRKYTAIVDGNLTEDRGVISSRIGRSESDRKKMSTRVRRGREAVTTWKVLERFAAATLIEAKLGTGRTHQIRVHFASVGHPVLGDRTYGRKTLLALHGRKILFHRQMLHAKLLGFVHPVTGEQMEFRSELPADMEEAVATLRKLTRA